MAKRVTEPSATPNFETPPRTVPHRITEDANILPENEDDEAMQGDQESKVMVMFFDDLAFSHLSEIGLPALHTLVSIPCKKSQALFKCLEELHTHGRSELLTKYMPAMNGIFLVHEWLFGPCVRAACVKSFPEQCCDNMDICMFNSSLFNSVSATKLYAL